MAKKTTNYGLTKPLPEEFYDIAVQNENMDKIDVELFNRLPIIDAKSADYDMDAILLSGRHSAIYLTSGSTLGTPYKHGVSYFSNAMIISYVGYEYSSSGQGFQIAFPNGEKKMFIRRAYSGKIDPWERVYSSMDKPTPADIDAVSNTDFTNHTNNQSNPHGVTAKQVGLGNVPNVATNDQTPTYTKSTALAELASGEKMSTAFGKIAKAISDFIAHLSNNSNPHNVTAAQVGARPDGWVPTAAEVGATSIAEMTSHTGNKNNPHGVTAEQTGAVPTSRMINGKGLDSDVNITASDVAAVALNGTNTMTGDLSITKGTPRMILTNNSTGAEVRFSNTSNGAVMQAKSANETAYRQLRLYNTAGKAAGDVSDVLQIYSYNIAGETTQAVLHTGNKDKIFTYGTEDLVAGESKLENGKLYFVYE